MQQLRIQVDEKVVARLDSPARRTGQAANVLASEAIELHLEEIEDYHRTKDA